MWKLTSEEGNVCWWMKLYKWCCMGHLISTTTLLLHVLNPIFMPVKWRASYLGCPLKEIIRKTWQNQIHTTHNIFPQKPALQRMIKWELQHKEGNYTLEKARKKSFKTPKRRESHEQNLNSHNKNNRKPQLKKMRWKVNRHVSLEVEMGIYYFRGKSTHQGEQRY